MTELTFRLHVNIHRSDYISYDFVRNRNGTIMRFTDHTSFHPRSNRFKLTCSSHWRITIEKSARNEFSCCWRWSFNGGHPCVCVKTQFYRYENIKRPISRWKTLFPSYVVPKRPKVLLLVIFIRLSRWYSTVFRFSFSTQ